MQPIIELRNVTFGYGAVPVLERINLHLHHGQFAALVGPSGAGKSTLLKLILGMLRPSDGTVALGSKAKGPLRMAYVPQLETVDWNFPVTVEQVVLMGRTATSHLWPWPSREDKRLAREIMGELGIAELAQRHIRNLSGGQQQRAFLARALIAQPELLVLDEPTSGVDMRTAENVLHLLAQLNQRGITILMTTHDLNAAAAHLPWVICVNHAIIAQGEPETIFTEETLNRTYDSDLMVIRQDGMIMVHQRPHGHTRTDLIAEPVPGHAGDSSNAGGKAPRLSTGAKTKGETDHVLAA